MNKYIILYIVETYVIEKTILHYSICHAAIYEIFDAVSNEKYQKKNCGGDTVESLSGRDSYTCILYYIYTCMYSIL